MAHVSKNYPTRTVTDFVKQPKYIQRAIEKELDRDMLALTVLNQNYTAEGGAVAYDRAPDKYTIEKEEDLKIAEGANFPEVHMEDQRLQAPIFKFGRKMYVTFEDEARNQTGVVSRGTVRIRNLMVRGFDKFAIAALQNDADILTTTSVTGAAGWSAAATTAEQVIEDIFRARSRVNSEAPENGGQSYNADTVVISEDSELAFYLKKDLRDALKKSDDDNIAYTGKIGRIAGLTFLVSPYMPDTEAWVLDKGTVGGIADESIDGKKGLTVKPTRRDEDRERYIIQVKRHSNVIVSDPGAMTRILFQ